MGSEGTFSIDTDPVSRPLGSKELTSWQLSSTVLAREPLKLGDDVGVRPKWDGTAASRPGGDEAAAVSSQVVCTMRGRWVG